MPTNNVISYSPLSRLTFVYRKVYLRHFYKQGRFLDLNFIYLCTAKNFFVISLHLTQIISLEFFQSCPFVSLKLLNKNIFILFLFKFILFLLLLSEITCVSFSIMSTACTVLISSVSKWIFWRTCFAVFILLSFFKTCKVVM